MRRKAVHSAAFYAVKNVQTKDTTIIGSLSSSKERRFTSVEIAMIVPRTARLTMAFAVLILSRFPRSGLQLLVKRLTMRSYPLKGRESAASLYLQDRFSMKEHIVA